MVSFFDVAGDFFRLIRIKQFYSFARGFRASNVVGIHDIFFALVWIGVEFDYIGTSRECDSPEAVGI